MSSDWVQTMFRKRSIKSVKRRRRVNIPSKRHGGKLSFAAAKSKKRRRMVGIPKKRHGGKLSFAAAIRVAKAAVRKSKNKSLPFLVNAALRALKKLKVPIQVPRRHVIRIPKKGGFLPFVVPILSVLSAIGSLGGGAAAIAKAVNEAKVARAQLAENTRHNKAMEAQKIGSGLYMKPYKKGCGLYFD